MAKKKTAAELKKILAAHRAHKKRGTLRPEILKMYEEAGLTDLLEERAKPTKLAKQVERAQAVIDFFKEAPSDEKAEGKE